MDGAEAVRTSVPARLDRLPWSRFHSLVIAALGITWILDGLEVTLAGSVAAALQQSPRLHLTAQQVGLTGSAYLAGAVLGALFFGHLTDRLGRKRLFNVTLGLYLVATALTALSWNFAAFAAFRFLTGAGIGGEYSAINSAIQELIPARLRGRTDLAVNGSFWVGAALGAAASVWLLDPTLLPPDLGWRVAFGTGAALGLVILYLRHFLPESPRWLIARARPQEAAAVLERLRPPATAAVEARAIAELSAAEAASDIRGWLALGIPWVRAVLLVGIGIGIVQQVTGVNSIMYYGTQILSRSGLGIRGALVANVLNGVVSVLATFIGIALVGRTGRRPMLVIGLIGTTSSLLLLGVVSLLFQPSSSLAYLVLGAMALFLCFQQGFVSPVTWLLLSEIFPLKVRGLGMGAATLVLWGANFVVAFSFPQLVAGFGVSSTFFGFVLVGIVAVAFSYRYVPETGGRTLEAIEELLHQRYAQRGAD